MCPANNEKWKKQIMKGMELSNPGRIRNLGEKENYKYLAIVEEDTIKLRGMKEQIFKTLISTDRGKQRKLNYIP